MASREPPRRTQVRCAIYTRKSTEDGLDQAFNSLDAQREACAAYILSQRHEGWSLVDTAYDDGGFSGGSMERPALRQLLADIAARRIDTIVVYKIDRLTRSLGDFSRIVDVLDAADASFVSVTQAFNTTTSMGRLTLNVLLSFAQFEREVTGERIRDKIAASKARGMWMGGVVPLGYAVHDRKLVICEAEAVTVRHIFERYLALGSVAALAAELEAAGIASKPRKRAGEVQPARPLTRGAIYVMLRNRVYRGEIVHKGTAYVGEHPALLDADLFARVQAQLDSNKFAQRGLETCSDPSLLAGLLIDEHGRRMSPSHAVKQRTQRYRYYVSRSDDSAEPLWRVPAGDLEVVVLGRLRALFAEPAALLDALDPLGLDAVALDAVLFAAGDRAAALCGAGAHALRQLLVALVSKVEVRSNEVLIHVRRQALAREPMPNAREADDLVLTVEGRFARVGKQVRMVVGPSGEPPRGKPDPALVKLLVKAHAARAAILASDGRSVDEIAEEQGHARDYFGVLLRVSTLDPQVVCAILDGRQPAELTRQQLARMHLPISWDRERVGRLTS